MIPPTFLALSLLLFQACLVQAEEKSPYVGSKQCASCHQQAYRDWQQSHHWQAMQAASQSTVLGDFSNASFTHFGVTSTFYRKDDRFFVRTDNAQGALQEFAIDYTFGFYPLQQYLIRFDDGRYQALSVAWDSRPADEGGQRWFHLYPDEAIAHDDPLHWTGAFQNWNSRCASCHSTNLEKNYDEAQNHYATEWSEINVACEACHGPGSQHMAWAERQRSGPLSDATNTDTTSESLPNKGLSTRLTADSQWHIGDKPTRSSGGPAAGQQQLATCGGCHSRRQELTQAHPGADFLNQYSPSLLIDGLYHADGQIDDEVYVYGSFIQSKMHAAGVVCSNCHEPHSLKLRAEGNALCGQCHDEATFDQAGHHHHPAGSPGAECVNCHMPERTYMVVDPRRDHSFRVPQPAFSELFDTPNACTTCHRDRDNAWAKQALQQWSSSPSIRDSHTPTFTIARNDRPEALPALLKIIADDRYSSIVRATALQESGRFPSPQALAASTEQLYSQDGLIRMAAVRSLTSLPAEQRFILLEPLLTDPVKAVRMEVANTLSPLNLKGLQPPAQEQLNQLFDEYVTAQRFSADMPSAQLNLGNFYINRGQPQKAVQAYQHALKLSPAYLPAMLNLADLYRDQQLDAKAKPLLQQAIDTAPDWAPARHAMGLLLIRQQQLDAALPYLGRAAELAPENARYSYVYGVALHGAGKPGPAIAVLTEAASIHPHHRELQQALRAYQQQATGAKPQ